MLDVFKSRQRKVGCALLVVALGLLGAWARSQVLLDVIEFRLIRRHGIASISGRLFLRSWDEQDSSRPAGTLDTFRLTNLPHAIDETRELRFHDDHNPRQWEFSYAAIVVLLSLSSACFILRKPQK
jgi:hypothetical protein